MLLANPFRHATNNAMVKTQLSIARLIERLRHNDRSSRQGFGFHRFIHIDDEACLILKMTNFMVVHSLSHCKIFPISKFSCCMPLVKFAEILPGPQNAVNSQFSLSIIHVESGRVLSS